MAHPIDGGTLKAGIATVVFNRGTKRYHGKVKTFADSVWSVGVRLSFL
jgi:ribosomal protein L18